MTEMPGVHCRIGSLEIPVGLAEYGRSVHCRIGSLENKLHQQAAS